MAFSLARILALHGITTLIVGLDIQGSITELVLNPLSNTDSLEDLPDYAGLAQVIKGSVKLQDAIISTDLPTLDVLPETPGLGPLEKHIRNLRNREKILSQKLVEPLKNEYQVIIFDNGPSWNMLIENSLFASNNVVSPVGCDLGSYQALPTNLESTMEFQEEMGIPWDNFILVPTLLENSKISKQIYGSYLTSHRDFITHNSIRRAVKGQEALACGRSVIETDPKSQLSTDVFDLVNELWQKM